MAGESIVRIMLAEQRYREAHRKVGELIGGLDGTLAFTRNATESINMVAGGLAGRKGDKVVTTLTEHRSSLFPGTSAESAECI
jgi:selenocysteine lyase/cysteine desulfurase